jgi:hypothetical protein
MRRHISPLLLLLCAVAVAVQQQELVGSESRLQAAREAVLKLLQYALGGDELGAEALLLSLLSQTTAQ